MKDESNLSCELEKLKEMPFLYGYGNWIDAPLMNTNKRKPVKCMNCGGKAEPVGYIAYRCTKCFYEFVEISKESFENKAKEACE